MKAVFALTLFISALLLFLVQPMLSKMILPVFGGVPSVWNTCVFFFQTELLVAYVYAHLLATRCSAKQGSVLHSLVLLAPLVLWHFAPSIRLPSGSGAYAELTLLGWLCTAIGLPFFAVATTSPLLQSRFASTNQDANPYTLYVASNLGSFAALLCYPTAIEPFFSTTQQWLLWQRAFIALIVAIGLCFLAKRKNNVAYQPQTLRESPTRPSWSDRCYWITAAAIPSSLMLGITTHITTDLASIPLFWIVPLAIYLVTLSAAFMNRPPIGITVIGRVLTLVVLFMMPCFFFHSGLSPASAIPLQLFLYTLAAYLCHLRLAAAKPHPAHLTEFYLFLAFGGVLGSAVNTFLAPLLFNAVLEYPIMFTLACLFLPGRDAMFRWHRKATIPFILLCAYCTAALTVLGHNVPPLYIALLALQIIPICICFWLKERPLPFTCAVAVMCLSLGIYRFSFLSNAVFTDRNFFGVKEITYDAERQLHLFIHGTTIHGMQSVVDERRIIPLAYYHPDGPLGSIFSAIGQTSLDNRFAILGLGAGAEACYAKKGEHFLIFEIDPMIATIAADRRYFSYLDDCPGIPEVRVGDGRLLLQQLQDGSLYLLMLDAFSSDSVPAHLLTKEAFELYFSKMEQNGILVANVSNRYVNLEPIIANLAKAMSIPVLILKDSPPAGGNGERFAATYMVLSRDQTVLTKLAKLRAWVPAQSDDSLRVWTDDYSDILSVLQFTNSEGFQDLTTN